MNKARHLSLAFGVLAAVLVVVACQDTASPPVSPGNITAGHQKPEGCADFRLTGGGRTDARDHDGYAKNTPGSHDFATFGFQARPEAGCPSDNAGSGQQEWNEHGGAPENAFGAPFAFHGRVTTFSAVEGLEGQCGTYSGVGRLNFHSGEKYDDVLFTVNHACDVQEPGVGHDHISITISLNGTTYERHGLLSGGNIQWHRLTGNN